MKTSGGGRGEAAPGRGGSGESLLDVRPSLALAPEVVATAQGGSLVVSGNPPGALT